MRTKYRDMFLLFPVVVVVTVIVLAPLAAAATLRFCLPLSYSGRGTDSDRGSCIWGQFEFQLQFPLCLPLYLCMRSVLFNLSLSLFVSNSLSISYSIHFSLSVDSFHYVHFSHCLFLYSYLLIFDCLYSSLSICLLYISIPRPFSCLPFCLPVSISMTFCLYPLLHSHPLHPIPQQPFSLSFFTLLTLNVPLVFSLSLSLSPSNKIFVYRYRSWGNQNGVRAAVVVVVVVVPVPHCQGQARNAVGNPMIIIEIRVSLLSKRGTRSVSDRHRHRHLYLDLHVRNCRFRSHPSIPEPN